MKNKEKYAKEIIDIAINSETFSINKKNNHIVMCSSLMCRDCLFNDNYPCQINKKIWANNEYTEEAIK